MERMLVTGAAGLLGREIVAVFGKIFDVVPTDVGECDVTRAESVRSVMARVRPSIVVHCAAYTAVDRAESEPARAAAVNVLGTRIVARECRESGALLVTFGSDYIFDGTKNTPYDEEDPPNPLSVYGVTKRDAEAALREEGAAHLLIRSQWLYGAGGRNFVSTILAKARRKEPLRVVADQVGCPTAAADLADATRRLLLAGARGTYHFSNDGEASWFEFARFVLSQAPSGEADLRPARSAELAYPARRPAYSVLSKERYRTATGAAPRRWEEAAAEFIAEGGAGV